MKTHKSPLNLLMAASACIAAVLTPPALAHAAEGVPIRLLLKDGKVLEGSTELESIGIEVSGMANTVPLRRIRSIQFGGLPSPLEAAEISAGLEVMAGKNRSERDKSADRLVAIGLPAAARIIEALKDVDLGEPLLIYRVFERIVPAGGDAVDRSADLVRLADGPVRGKITTSSLSITLADGKVQNLNLADVRSLAVKQKKVERTIRLHALHHCTQIDFCDTGLTLSPESKVSIRAEGWVRLDFNTDGWSSDPDGLQKPGPRYNTNLVDGFPFGALVGKSGADPIRWLAGKKSEKSGLTGRLYLAVNDNPHWQNNVGGFTVKLTAMDCYDMGDGI